MNRRRRPANAQVLRRPDLAGAMAARAVGERRETNPPWPLPISSSPTIQLLPAAAKEQAMAQPWPLSTDMATPQPWPPPILASHRRRSCCSSRPRSRGRIRRLPSHVRRVEVGRRLHSQEPGDIAGARSALGGVVRRCRGCALHTVVQGSVQGAGHATAQAAGHAATQATAGHDVGLVASGQPLRRP